jgi:hypothetical protein
MKVAAIVLSYNSAGYISDCIHSLQKLNLGKLEFEIIVVDNASSDNSLGLISEKFPEVTLIQNSQNQGYAEGNNVGIRAALTKQANFVWIVNPDIVVDENSLTELVDAANKYKQAGIFGSKIYFAPGFEFHKDRYTKKDIGKVFWYAGGNVDWGNLIASHRGVDLVDQGQFNEDIETDFVTGASMFIRSKVFDSIGLIDAKYFLYFEENDFCQKSKTAGWKLMYIPGSVAWHANAQATGIGSALQDYYITRNRMLFGMRHAPPYTRLHLIKQSIELYFKGRPWQKRAIIDYYTQNFGPGSYQP